MRPNTDGYCAARVSNRCDFSCIWAKGRGRWSSLQRLLAVVSSKTEEDHCLPLLSVVTWKMCSMPSTSQSNALTHACPWRAATRSHTECAAGIASMKTTRLLKPCSAYSFASSAWWPPMCRRVGGGGGGADSGSVEEARRTWNIANDMLFARGAVPTRPRCAGGRREPHAGMEPLRVDSRKW